MCPANVFKENLKIVKQHLIDNEKTPFMIANDTDE